MTRIIAKLDSWRLWVGVAYFGLAALAIVFAIIVSGIQADQARDAAYRDARAAAEYERCLDSVPVFEQVNRYLDGVRDLASVLVSNAAALLAETPANHPMRPVRQQNFEKLGEASAAIGALRDFPSRSHESCQAAYERHLVTG